MNHFSINIGEPITAQNSEKPDLLGSLRSVRATVGYSESHVSL